MDNTLEYSRAHQSGHLMDLLMECPLVGKTAAPSAPKRVK